MALDSADARIEFTDTRRELPKVVFNETAERGQPDERSRLSELHSATLTALGQLPDLWIEGLDEHQDPHTSLEVGTQIHSSIPDGTEERSRSIAQPKMDSVNRRRLDPWETDDFETASMQFMPFDQTKMDSANRRTLDPWDRDDYPTRKVDGERLQPVNPQIQQVSHPSEKSDSAVGSLQGIDAEQQAHITDALVHSEPADRMAVPGTGLVDRAGSSEEFARRVDERVSKLPPGVQKLLKDSGYRFVAAGDMRDFDPALAQERPRGWPPGTTWANADGLNKPGTILVTERRRDSNGDLVTSTRTEGVLLHEAGHALDDALGEFSHSDEFKDAFDKDFEGLSAEDKTRFAYLLQGQPPKQGEPINYAGLEETFADVFAGMNGTCTNSADTSCVLAKFPHVRAAIEKRIGQLPQ